MLWQFPSNVLIIDFILCPCRWLRAIGCSDGIGRSTPSLSVCVQRLRIHILFLSLQFDAHSMGYGLPPLSVPLIGAEAVISNLDSIDRVWAEPGEVALVVLGPGI